MSIFGMQRRDWAAVAFGLAAGWVLASGQGDALVKKAWAALTVFDPSNMAKNAETAAQTAQLVLTAKDHLERAQSTLKSLGNADLSAEVNRALFAVTEAATTAIGDSRRIGQGQGMSLLAPLNTGSAVEPLSVAESVGKVDQMMASSSGILNMESAWFDVANTAQKRSLGASIYHIDNAAKITSRIGPLAQSAEEAASMDKGSLRTQVAVLTAAVLQNTEEVAQLRHMIATSVAAQSAQELAKQSQGGIKFRARATSSAPGVGGAGAGGAPPVGSSGVFGN